MTSRRMTGLAAIVVAVAGGIAALQAFGDTQAAASEYVGLSAQRLPIKLTVEGDGKTLSLDVTWSPVCEAVQRTVRAHVATIGGDGTFSWESSDVDVVEGGDGDERRMSYRLQGRRNDDGTLSGVWHAETGLYDREADRVEDACSSDDVAFSVRQGASTEQPPPRTDAFGRLVVSMETTPRTVAVGAGHTWVAGDGAPPGPTSSASRTPDAVTQIDSRTGATGPVSEVTIGDRSIDVLTAGEGAAWVLGNPQPFRLFRIDAQTRQVRQARAPTRYAQRITSSVAAGSRAVWLAQDADGPGARLLRVDPRAGGVAPVIGLPPLRHRGCRADKSLGLHHVVTGNRAVWVTGSTSYTCRTRSKALVMHHTLTQVDPKTNRIKHRFELGQGSLPGRGLGAPIAAGPGGVFGVTCLKLVRGKPGVENQCGRARLQRLDVRAGPRTVASLPTGLVVGLAVSRKAYWVSEQLGAAPGGALIRIDRATKRRTTVLRTRRKPSNVAVGDGVVWVADPTERRVLRIPE